MKTLKIVAFYDSIENEAEKRERPPAACNKLDYIISALQQLDYEVEVISMSSTMGTVNAARKEYTDQRGVKIHLFDSFGKGSKLNRILNHFVIRMEFFMYLIQHLSSQDTVWVYHSLLLLRQVSWAKKIRRFKMILEAEEIYADVIGDEKARKKEWKIFSQADAFVFPTQLLDEKINISRKPSAVIHGVYSVPDLHPRDLFRDEGNEIKHLLYAGTLDPRKGGMVAVDMARYLGSEFHIHILGFGNDVDVARMKDAIRNLEDSGNAKVTYEGLLNGDDYIRFVQNCDVGLSPQNLDAAFNNTSFPSKILSYLSNGLRVVSVCMPSLQCSAVNDLLFYADSDKPEDIAKAVEKIDFHAAYDSRIRIQELSAQFISNVNRLLQSMKE